MGIWILQVVLSLEGEMVRGTRFKRGQSVFHVSIFRSGFCIDRLGWVCFGRFETESVGWSCSESNGMGIRKGV